jgi:O-antigen ligase
MLALSVFVSLDTLWQLQHGSDLLGRTYKGVRLTALFPNSNYLALFLAGMVPIHIHSIQRSRKFSGKIMLSFPLIICLVSIGLSGTRSAWVAVLLLFLFWYLYAPGKKSRIIYLLMPVIIIPIIYFKGHEIVSKRYHQTENIAKSPRVVMWGRTIEVIKETPLLGAGFDSYRHVDKIVIETKWDKGKKKLKSFSFPHFFLFEIWQTSGMFALLAFLFFLYRIVVVNVNYIRERKEYVFLFLSWVMVFLTSVINIPFFSRYVSFAFWFYLGLLSGAVEFQRREVRQDVR